jgi:predicted O-methyltransferase YrrM
MRLKHLIYLLRTGAPVPFLFRYALDQSARRQAARQHAQAKSAFREKLKTGKFSDDWFSPHVPHWLKAFEQCSFKQERPLRILEVGSFEGMATSFLLQHFPNAHITSVDTWDGSDEHDLDFRAVEDAFDFNLKPHAHRLSKFKGESHLYFATEGRNARFDLIYVDGSHFSDDVLIDAVNAFNHLENGGMLIFDDYLWRHYPRRRDNPAAAINLFLKFNAGLYDLLQIHSQVFIRKTGDTQTHRKKMAG